MGTGSRGTVYGTALANWPYRELKDLVVLSYLRKELRTIKWSLFMMAKNSLSALLLLFVPFIGSAQSGFTVPEDPKLESEEDHISQQDNILECIDWFMNTPYDEQEKKWKRAKEYFMKWAQGSPTVTIVLGGRVTDATNENSILLLIFMAGWTEHSLENPDQKDKLKGNQAGYRAMATFYEKEKENGLEENPLMEKLVEKKKEGELDQWVKEEFESR